METRTPYLIEKGASINARSTSNSTPIFYTVDVEVLKILKAAGADLEAATSDGSTLLLTSVANEREDIVDYLIKAKVDLDRKNNVGANALSTASYWNYLSIVESLVGAGADINLRFGETQFSALSTALLRDNNEVALFLIDNGADVESISSEGFTSVHVAAQRGNLPAVKALASAGANLEVKGGSFEMTPLALAAINGHDEVVKYLKSTGVDLEATNLDGKTAQDLAADQGFDFVVKLLAGN